MPIPIKKIMTNKILPEDFPKELKLENDTLIYCCNSYNRTIGRYDSLVTLAGQEIIFNDKGESTGTKYAINDLYSAHLYMYDTWIGDNVTPWGMGWQHCKDYVNDWLFKVASRFHLSGIYTGAYFHMRPVIAEPVMLEYIENCLLSIQTLLKDLGYENPQTGIRIISIDLKSLRFHFRIEEGLLSMPPVISCIMMLWRNAMFYKRGQSIKEFLTNTSMSRASQIETSPYSDVMNFIQYIQGLRNKGITIREYFGPMVQGWDRRVGMEHGSHSIFGVSRFMNNNIYLNAAYTTKTYEAPNG